MANVKKDIVKVGFILFAITAFAALVLAIVNSFTAPVIAENNKRAQDIAMKKVLPEAENFEQLEYLNDGKDSVREIYSGGGAGVVVKVSPNGYGGKIDMVVGVDADYKVTGIEIIAQTETAGLGTNCTKDSFKAQFVGKTDSIKVVKSGAKDNEIDAISSATITSKAVAKGVNEAVLAAKNIAGGE